MNVSLVGTITGLGNLRKTQPKKKDLSDIQYPLLRKFYTCFSFLLQPKDGCTTKPCHMVQAHGVVRDILVKMIVFLIAQHEQNI